MLRYKADSTSMQKLVEMFYRQKIPTIRVLFWIFEQYSNLFMQIGVRKHLVMVKWLQMVKTAKKIQQVIIYMLQILRV